MTAIIYTDEDLITLADKLLTHIEGHLEEQFRDGRIQGTDYAQVYIAGIQASMAQAQAFLLGKDIAGGQASILTEQRLQAEDQTTISVATVDERIALIENQKTLLDEQIVQALVQGDITDQQALQAVKNTSLVSIQEEIATSTKDKQIAIIENQKLASDEQVVQLLVQGDIQDDQKLTTAQQVLQSLTATSLGSIQEEIADAIKDEQIAITENQKLISDEQLVQLLIQGNIQDDQKLTTAQQVLQASKKTSLVTTQDEVATSVKQDQIDGVAAQTELAEEELRILKERHGMNLVPQYP